MNLTNQQIEIIDNYLRKCGINYIDVRAELVDHFASVAEKKLTETPDLDLKKTIIEEHKNFGENGFKELLKSKEKATTKFFFRMTFQHFLSFFKLPKIIVSFSLFFMLAAVMNSLERTNTFFIILAILLMGLWASTIRNFRQKQEFLCLERTTHFQLTISMFYHVYYLIYVLRNEASFLNTTHNYGHLPVFVLFLLFYWCGEYVFKENARELKKLYPQIF